MNKLQYLVIIVLLTLTACSLNKEGENEDNHLYRILVGEKYGFMDAHGRIAIEPQFDDAYTHFSEGLCFVKSGERVGLIDSTGTIVVELPDTIRYVSNFVHGIARVSCGFWKIGIIDTKGNYIITPEHYDARVNIDGDSTYLVVEDFKWRIFDKKGISIGDEYDNIHVGFCDGLCEIMKNGKWGYIDPKGKFVIDTIYDATRVFSEDGVARVRKDNKYSYINKKGKELFSVDSTLTGLVCNRAAVIMKGKKCLVNKKGKKICTLDVDDIYGFTAEDSLATIIKDGKAAKIDTMGNVILKTDYDYIGTFIDGIASVRKDNKLGFINREGTEIIEVTHEGYDFHGKDFRIRVVRDEMDGITCFTYYNLEGKLLWKDMPSRKKPLPDNPTREDFVEYFDARITELDPIEGIYYVTSHNFYQNRTNPNISGSNGTESTFLAVAKLEDPDAYTDATSNDIWVYSIDNPGSCWKNKFVKIGDSNSYAIMDNKSIEKDKKYSSEGRVTLEDPNKFEFQLEQENNGWYNFYVTYEFVKDYPPTSDYEMAQRPEWSGTGFAIYDGYIATNYHVANGAKTIRVRGIDGDMKKSYKGFVVAKDKEHDIAIIRIADKDFDGFGEIPYAIGKAVVDVGDDIFVLGYPMTDTMGEEIKLTDGVISSSSGYKGNESMYQISAAVQPGNSGGPLFNEDGSVIGIVCAKHAEAENANYAIKISYLYNLVSSAKLGIDISNSSHENSKKLSKKVKKFRSHVYLIECSSK